jgi:hypothetical protein
MIKASGDRRDRMPTRRKLSIGGCMRRRRRRWCAGVASCMLRLAVAVRGDREAPAVPPKILARSIVHQLLLVLPGKVARFFAILELLHIISPTVC